MKWTTWLLIVLPALVIWAEGTEAKKTRRAYRQGFPAHRSSGSVMLTTPNPVTPLEHNNRGVELGSKGLWPDAIREHEIALREDPDNKTFRTNLSAAQLRYGDVLKSKGDYYHAMLQYRGALYVDPNNLTADLHLDQCLAHAKQDPSSLKVRRQLADEADVHGDYETAIVEYRKCVKMADDGPSHAKLGRVLLKAGKVVDGYSELKIAVSKSWDGHDKLDLGACHRQLGDVLKEYAYKAKETGRGTVGMKRLLNAAVEYRRAITLNRGDADALRSFIEVAREGTAIKPVFDNYLMLGGAYLLAGDFAHAKLAYDQCYKLNPRNPALAPARIAYHQEVARSALASPELIAESLTKVQQLLENEPDNARWWYILGRLKEHQSDFSGALAAYDKAEKINPLIDPDLKLAVARVGGSSSVVTQAADNTQNKASPGQIDKSGTASGKSGTSAVKPSDKASGNLSPVLAKESSQTLVNLQAYAQVEKLLQAKDLDGALKLVMTILEKDNTSGHTWLLKGNIHQQKGELADAATCFHQAALFKEPEAESAWRQVSTMRVQPNIERAEQFKKEGNWIKAADELRESITIAPNLAIVHRKLGEILRQLGDSKGAEKEALKAQELEKGN